MYSTDVFSALHHVTSTRSNRELAPIIVIVFGLVTLSILQRIMVDPFSGELVLWFELGLTTLIMLMHLFAALMTEKSKLLYMTVVVSLVRTSFFYFFRCCCFFGVFNFFLVVFCCRRCFC